MRKRKDISNIKNTFLEYVRNNSKEYILVILIFIIGIFVGVMFINNCSDEKQTIIANYISSFIDKFQNTEVDNSKMMVNSVKKDFILSAIIWISGTTIIGMPVVLGIILYRGFCLGYTISAISFTIGAGKGILFCISALFLQNILFIPAILTTGVSSMKLYKSIIADRRKENIKIEIVRHTIISLIMLCILILSSLVENEISIRLLKFYITICN